MNKQYKIKDGLKRVGRVVCLADGNWTSMPFYAVIVHKYKKNKTNFESDLTEIGYVTKDYYTYIGPFDHDITALSENGFVLADGEKFVFMKKEKVECENSIVFYCGILKRVTEDEDD